MPTFRPTALGFNYYGWRGSQPYNAADVPVPNYLVTQGVDRTVLEQQFAYEWFDSSSKYSGWTNPPFASSGGRLLPQFLENGQPQRILRGFIRRAEYDSSDPKSAGRLYFMYNPETITRDYVSYLDQGALDPFNTVYQSGNLVPPPSYMDFSFSLLFDRQIESVDPTFPGVFVDYQFFDLVVRNILPTMDPNTTSSTQLPDNGIMMVNPRDVTVVFSPQITVQGRPLNARVTFQKFTHRMVPVRMQIDLTMRVTYFGPMKDMTEYKADETVAAASIPWDTVVASPFTMTPDDIATYSKALLENMKNNLLSSDQIQALLKDLPDSVQNALGQDTEANLSINSSIVEFGLKKLTDNHTEYDRSRRSQLWNYADCSSFVWGAFANHDPPYSTDMGWLDWNSYNKGIQDTSAMIAMCEGGQSPVKEIFKATSTSASARSTIITAAMPNLVKGDLLFRKAGIVPGHDSGGTPVGHVAFVYSNNTDAKTLELVDAARPGLVGKRSTGWNLIISDYTHCYRPMVGTKKGDN